MSNEIRSSWMMSRLRFGRKWYWPFQDIPIKPKETEEGYEKVTKASMANMFPPLYLRNINLHLHLYNKRRDYGADCVLWTLWYVHKISFQVRR